MTLAQFIKRFAMRRVQRDTAIILALYSLYQSLGVYSVTRR